MAIVQTEKEIEILKTWYRETFLAALNHPGKLPVSFVYNDKPAAEVTEAWNGTLIEDATADGTAYLHTLKLKDPSTGLEVRCEITEYTDFPAIEWVAYFRNEGDADTPIIADIQALDALFSASPETACTLHHAKGSDCKIDDFEPLATPLPAGAAAYLGSTGGRSSNGALPFFNLRLGDGGVIGAVGWTGDWAVNCSRSSEGAIRVRAGMQKTHLTLHPGEEIRSPRILLLFWEGERQRAQNLLRRFIIAHHTPVQNGEPLKAPICASVWGENYDRNQIAKAHWWAEHKMPIDAFWIDAGWHGDGKFLEDSNVFNSEWWRHVGNWWPNKTTYPEGLKPVGDTCRELGFGFVLWLEPERVFKDTFFTHEHPEWLLGPIGDNSLYNLGDPQAREALTDLLSGLISEGSITIYRQDFNFEPAPYWEANDAPDRVGISEIRHIEGLYRFWDDLRERFPGLAIDNCSSGGRRIDLETISRSIPLWRSDFQCYPDFDPLSQQAQTQGLGQWVPLNTGCCDRVSDYAFRSALGPGVVICTSVAEQDPEKYFDADWLLRRVQEQVDVRPYFYGDFYPLLSFSLATDTWAAWQYDRPDLGEGMVIAFRRQDSPFVQMQAVLHGLDPQATYEIHCLDDGSECAKTGNMLMENGLTIEISSKPAAALCVYKKL